MRQENERVSRPFYNDNFTPSGHGRAHAIVNAAGHAWDLQATVCHQALQASRTYHLKTESHIKFTPCFDSNYFSQISW